jgi:hypothetical protein
MLPSLYTRLSRQQDSRDLQAGACAAVVSFLCKAYFPSAAPESAWRAPKSHPQERMTCQSIRQGVKLALGGFPFFMHALSA